MDRLVGWFLKKRIRSGGSRCSTACRSARSEETSGSPLPASSVAISRTAARWQKPAIRAMQIAQSRINSGGRIFSCPPRSSHSNFGARTSPSIPRGPSARGTLSRRSSPRDAPRAGIGGHGRPCGRLQFPQARPFARAPPPSGVGSGGDHGDGGRRRAGIHGTGTICNFLPHPLRRDAFPDVGAAPERQRDGARDRAARVRPHASGVARLPPVEGQSKAAFTGGTPMSVR